MNRFRKFVLDYSTVFRNVGLGAGALVVAASVYLVSSRWQPAAPVEPDVTPIADRYGWAGPEVAAEAREQLGDAIQAFRLDGVAQDTRGKRVVLWEYSKKINGGKHFPTLRQQVGSCVGHGATNALWYLMAVQIALGNLPHEAILPYEPAVYGFMREAGGFRISGDGGVGAWAVDGAKRFGVVRSSIQGLPPWTVTEGKCGTTISFAGSVDRAWGRRPGVPQEYRPEAARHLLRAYAQVTSYDDVRDAIANGYPVTVASGVGFDGGMRAEGGKLWGVRGGSWSHQMCFIGVDDAAGRKGCYCLNSWGADAHGCPVDDAPPGGFWVDDEVVSAMVGQDDSFAWSSFDGFPEQELDFSIIRARAGARVVPKNPADN